MFYLKHNKNNLKKIIIKTNSHYKFYRFTYFLKIIYNKFKTRNHKDYYIFNFDDLLALSDKRDVKEKRKALLRVKKTPAIIKSL